MLDEAFNRLQDSIDHLTVMTERKERKDAFTQVGLVPAHISITLPSSQQFHDGIKTITATQTPHSVDPVHTLQKGINNTGPLPCIEDRIDIVTTDILVVGEISSLTKVPMVESLE